MSNEKLSRYFILERYTRKSIARLVLANAITSLEQLEQVIDLTVEERGGAKTAAEHLKIRISPHIATLINPEDTTRPVGLAAFLSSFRGSKLIPAKRRCLVPPTSPHQGATRRVTPAVSPPKYESM